MSRDRPRTQRRTRRSCCGCWRARRRWCNTRGARTGEGSGPKARSCCPLLAGSTWFCVPGAAPGPRGPRTTTGPASPSGSARERRTRAWARSGTTCCRPTRSSRTPPCPPTRPPAPSSSWRRCAGGWRKNRSALAASSPSRGEWAGLAGAALLPGEWAGLAGAALLVANGASL